MVDLEDGHGENRWARRSAERLDLFVWPGGAWACQNSIDSGAVARVKETISDSFPFTRLEGRNMESPSTKTIMSLSVFLPGGKEGGSVMAILFPMPVTWLPCTFVGLDWTGTSGPCGNIYTVTVSAV